jgi:pimeloyl-ACP methyl ester carboxylesterase
VFSIGKWNEVMELELIYKKPKTRCNKPPILFIHGAFNAAWNWEKNFLSYFSERGYHAYAVSLRGHGTSPGREKLQSYNIMDYVRDIEEAIDKIGMPPIIVGHSMGGFITQKYLEKNTVPAAVLVASVPPFGVAFSGFRMLRKSPRIFLRINAKQSFTPMVKSGDGPVEGIFSNRVDPAVVHFFDKQLQDESYRAFMDMLVLKVARPWKIKTPLLVLGAGIDSQVPPWEVKATAKIYRAPCEIFPEMGHAVMAEPDWKNMAETMENWFEQLI